MHEHFQNEKHLVYDLYLYCVLISYNQLTKPMHCHEYWRWMWVFVREQASQIRLHDCEILKWVSFRLVDLVLMPIIFTYSNTLIIIYLNPSYANRFSQIQFPKSDCSYNSYMEVYVLSKQDFQCQKRFR